MKISTLEPQELTLYIKKISNFSFIKINRNRGVKEGELGYSITTLFKSDPSGKAEREIMKWIEATKADMIGILKRNLPQLVLYDEGELDKYVIKEEKDIQTIRVTLKNLRWGEKGKEDEKKDQSQPSISNKHSSIQLEITKEELFKVMSLLNVKTSGLEVSELLLKVIQNRERD